MASTAHTIAGRWKSGLRRRAATWAQRRQGDDRLPLTLHTRRIYILPTRAGFAFAALLLVMLLAGLNYGNSIALLFTFLLAGFALIAMHLCHRNLAGTVVHGVATVDAFAGEHGRLLITLENHADSPRIGLEARIDDIQGDAGRTSVSVQAEGSARADIAVPLARRGRVPVERIKLSTSFPFGLFRAWTWLHLPIALIAWPVPRGRREPPQQAASGGSTQSVHRAGDEEWAGLRVFRDGDSPRQVAWAAYARGRGLLVKTYQSPAAHHRQFDLASVPGELEQRLEQLAAWVVGAHARGERYGLKLDDAEVAPDGGNEHRERCLDALALYGSGQS
jgi:uncharacterized protein (DUF58 family)